MKFRDAINDGLKNKKNVSCGNYAVRYIPAEDFSIVSMFGNDIFFYDHSAKSVSYDFCGHEGYPRTTKAMNICLEAIGWKLRLKTDHGKVNEVR